MKTGKNANGIRNAMFIVTLLAVITLGFTVFASDDGYAATSGDVVEFGSDVPIGTYELSAGTLSIVASDSFGATNIVLSDFDEGAKSEVKNIVISGFTENLCGLFTSDVGYTGLLSVKYTGDINTPAGSKWTFDFSNNHLTVAAPALSNDTSITLSGFNFQSSVSRIIFINYTKDLSGSFDSSYTSLDSYQGELRTTSSGSPVIGSWTYTISSTTLLIEKVGITELPTNWTSSNAPFVGHFFKTQVTDVELRGFTSGGNNIMYGFSALERFTAYQYSKNDNANLLAGGLTSLKYVRFDAVTSVGSTLLSNVKSTIVEIDLRGTTTITNSAFKGYAALKTVSLPNVTTIDYGAFHSCTALTTIDMPILSKITNPHDSKTHGTFYGCTSLVNVTLPGVQSLGNGTFYDCTSLKTFAAPNLTSVTSAAFYNCSSLVTCSTPALNTIGSSAFRNCYALVTITLGEGAKIGESVFYDCTNLSSITEENILSLGHNAFRNCTSLTGPLHFDSLVSVASTNNDNSAFRGSGITEVYMPKVNDIGSAYLFYACSNLTFVSFSALQEIIDRTFQECISLTTVKLSPNTTKIHDYAFYKCYALTTINFNDALEEIHAYAFQYSGLESLDIKNVLSIGNEAFRHCTSLTSISIGPKLQSIGSNVFVDVPIASDLEFPATMESIGASAFQGSRIKSVTFASQGGGEISYVVLGASAFQNCDSLESVNLNDAVSSVGDTAFYDCNILASLNIGEKSKLTFIGDSAFHNCTTLSSHIVFPASLATLTKEAFYASGITGVTFHADSVFQTIGSDAFRECRALVSVNIPKSVTTIDVNAFYQDTSLTTVSLDDGSKLVSIGTSAFNGCTSLASTFAFPKTLNTIGNSAFLNCNKLKGVTFSEEQDAVLSSIGDSAFESCTQLSSTIKFPDSLQIINADAFYGCSTLKGISFGDGSSLTTIGTNAFRGCTLMVGELDLTSVTSIGDHAFYQCKAITEAYLGNALTALGTTAFYDCDNLVTISFPADSILTTIKNQCFDGCEKLSGVGGVLAIPNSITDIGNHAFRYCDGIESIVFGSSLVSIGTSAFNSCNSLSGVLVFPNALETIANSAFYDCSNLQGISFDVNNSELTSIGSGAFYNCKMTDDLVLPNSLETIADGHPGAFQANMFESITFGSSLTSIGNYAFYSTDYYKGTRTYEGLGNLIIPKSVTYIGSQAFYDCDGLIGVTFEYGSLIETIGESAFNGADGMLSVICESGVPVDKEPTIGKSAFADCDILETFIMNNIVSVHKDGILEVSKKVSVFKMAGLKSVTRSLIDQFTSLRVVDLSSVTSIEVNMFKDFKGLESVDISSVVSVPDTAFIGCDALNTVDISSATSIGADSFNGCSKLVTLITVANITSVGDNAFNGCSKLTGIHDYEGLQMIGDNAFNGCTALTPIDGIMLLTNAIDIGDNAFRDCNIIRFVIGASVLTIGDGALYNANLEVIDVHVDNGYYTVKDGVLYDKGYHTLLFSPAKNPTTIVSLPDTVTVIKPYAFQGAKTLKTLALHSGTLSIGAYAFNGSGIIGKLTISEHVTAIGEYAFADCTGLSEIVIEARGANVLGAYAFKGCSSVDQLTIPITVRMVDTNGNPVFDASSSIKSYVFTGYGGSGLGDFYKTYGTLMPWYFSEAGDASISVEFTEGVESIDSYMFKNATLGLSRINAITLPDTVREIKAEAFYNCSKIKDLTIPKSLTTIGTNVLKGCISIQNLTIPINVDASKFGQVVSSIRSLTFVGDSVLGVDYTSNNKTNVIWYGSSNYSVIFSDGIRSIGNNMQLSATGTVSIPSSVESIGTQAFYTAPLTGLVIVDGLTTIKDFAFEGCSGLQTLTLPNTLVTIGMVPFKNCTTLKTVYLPITVDYSSAMFDGCNSLTQFIFKAGTNGEGRDYTKATAVKTPWYGICGQYDFNISFEEGVKSVGEYMFYGCVKFGNGGTRGLSGIVTFPDSITSIEKGAFEGCYKVEKFVFGTGLSSIGVESFKDCYGFYQLTIENSLSTIGAGAFSGCTRINTLTIPIHVNTVGSATNPIFKDCIGITKITFTGITGFDYAGSSSDSYYQLTPWYFSKENSNMSIIFDGSVTSIGDYMFMGCTGFSGELVIPAAMVDIGKNAFSGCTSISSLQIDDYNLRLGTGAFNGCIGIQNLRLPITMNAVVSDTSPVFEGCTGIKFLYLTGNGNGVNYTDTSGSGTNYHLTPWYYSRNNTISVDIGSGITGIGSNMFRGCTGFYGNAGMLQIASPITSIGEYAFEDNVKIKRLYLHVVSLNIGKGAFKGCTGMTALEIPITMNAVGYSDVPIFEGSSGLTDLSFIGSGAVFNYSVSDSDSKFYQKTPWYIATGNFTVTFADTITSIGNNMFRDNAHLNGDVILTNVKSIGEYAFYSCIALDSMDADSVTSLGEHVFEGCSTLSTVSLDALQSVSDYTFKDCESLLTVDLLSVKAIGSYSFQNSGVKKVNSNDHVNLENVTSVGDYAFAGAALDKIVIGKDSAAISYFGDYVLNECKNLKYVEINSTIASIPSNTFRSASTPSTFASPLISIKAKKATVFAAMLTDYFRSLTTVEIDSASNLDHTNTTGMFRGCEKLNKFWTSDSTITLPASAFEGCSSLTGTSFNNFSSFRFEYGREFYGCTSLDEILISAPSVAESTFQGCESLSQISAPNLTSVGRNGFAGTGFTQITDVQFPSLTTVMDSVFADCKSLVSVELSGLTASGPGSFAGCNVLTSVTLPELTAISEGMFTGCSYLTNVFADKVTSIGIKAFQNCSALVSISLMKVVTVGDVNVTPLSLSESSEYTVFSGCSKLKTVSMPSVERIGAFAFYQCRTLNSFNSMSDVADLTGVTLVGYGAFVEVSFTNVTVGKDSSNTTVGDHSFSGCTSLKEFVIVGGIASIGSYSLNGCSLIESLTIPISSNWISAYKPTTLKSIHFTKGTNPVGFEYDDESYTGTFWYNSRNYSVTFDSGITSIGSGMRLSATGSVIVPATVSAIGDMAFYGAPMTSLTIYDGLVSIGKQAFANCTGLRSAVIPDSITYIGEFAFEGCITLASMQMPITVDYSKNTFVGCTSLNSFRFTKGSDGKGKDYTQQSVMNTPWYLNSIGGMTLTVTFDSGITAVGDNMFRGCSGLTGDLVLPSTVSAIGSHAFDGANKIRVLSIESTAVLIEDGAFKNCSGIKTLTIPIGINSVGSISSPIFENCSGITSISFIGSGSGHVYSVNGANSYKYTPWYYSRNNTINVTIDAGITSIGDYMFYDCAGLSGSVVANGVVTVGNNAFAGCVRMVGFEASALTTLGDEVFRGARSLTSVTLTQVLSVPAYTFYGCTELTSLTMTACRTIGAHAFEGSGIKNINGDLGADLQNVISIGDYAFAYSAVESIIIGNESANINMGDYVLLECPYLAEVNIKGKLSQLPKNTFVSEDSPDSFSSSLRTLVANQVQIISAVFTDFRSLTTVEISGATSLDADRTYGMFKGCTSLVTVTLYQGNNSIALPESAFEGCISLTTINLNSFMLNSGREFYGCESLTILNLDVATKIPIYAFYGCTDLTTVNALKVNSIAEFAFEKSGITEVAAETFPVATQVGEGAFKDCMDLRSVSFNNVSTVGNAAFTGCTNLASATFPKLVEITNSMFHGCSSLNSLSADLVNRVRELAFYGCRSLNEIELPEVREIGDIAAATAVSLSDYVTKAVFSNCTSLSRISMPKIQSIGVLAFYGCSTLVSFNADDSYDLSGVSAIRFGAFSGSGVTDVTVGKSNGISDIGDYAFYNCPRLVNFTSESLRSLPDHLFNDTDVKVTTKAPALVTVNVPSVGSFYANLHGCTYLTTVNAPNATSFGDNVFYGCTQLQNVTLFNDPESNQTLTLSVGMFSGCERLESIDLSKAVFDGGFDAGEYGDTFRGCKSLRSVVLPVATKVPSGAFAGCTNLSSLDAPVATIIGSDAFNGCISLGSAEIPKVTSVYERAFSGCTSLSRLNASTELSQFINIVDIRAEAFYRCAFTQVVLAPNLRTLGTSAFAFNPIVSLVLPNSKSSYVVGEKAFQGCPLEEVHISSSVARIGANAFDYSTVSTVTSAEFWFNGSITSSLFVKNSIVGNNRITLNINADADSESYVNGLERAGYVQNLNYNYFKRNSANIQLDTLETGLTQIASVSAIYGGKVVLPYLEYGTTYAVAGFATMDSGSNYLAIFASDSAFSAGRVALSGDAVPVYPMGDGDGMIFMGSESYDDGTFVYEITVSTNSYGYAVDIDSQTVHYGSELIVPTFQDSLMNVRGLSVVRMDGYVYDLDIALTEFFVGYWFDSVIILSEATTIEVDFISGGEKHTASVTIQGAFEVPSELKYLETPDAGSSFGGWWSSEGGKGIKAGPNTKFAIGQRWYAYFVPLEYTLTIVSDDPEYSAEFIVVGPFTLHVVNNSLYYRDTVNTSNTLVFDANTIVGYSVSTYTDRNNFGRVITGNYSPSVGNMIVDLFMDMNYYDLELVFTYNGLDIEDELFTINDWDIGVGTEFKTGSVITHIPYSMLENGLYMPLPVHNDYAFSEMHTGSMAVSIINGRYTLTLENFDGLTSTVVTYVMQKGMYTIQFLLQDDEDTVFNNSVSITIGDLFMMPSVARNYFKTGYVFSHLSIDGVDGVYLERQSVELTEDMVADAHFCVVTVRAIWSPVSYTIGFDVLPYKATLDPIGPVIVGTEITLPSVTGYSGYRVSGWHWVLGGTASDSFEGKVLLTQDIVANYADGTNITLQVEWSAKTYRLEVDPSTGYKFDAKTGTFGESVTLWKNTYSRSFMKFAGWAVGETVYGDAVTVTLDKIMAAAGDANGDRIVFSMSWIHNEYQVQYNLDGGEGQIPVDDNAYIVNQTRFTLAAYDDSFYQDGYTFIGWKYSKSSYIVYTNTTGLFETVLAQYADENNIVTFYAVWSQKSYKISYDLDGGRAGAYSPTNVFYGDEIVISKPTRAGYDFAGWTATGLTGGALYSSSAGYRGWDGVKMVTSTSFMDLCNVDGGVVTFTAHWEQATYMVSYNLNGGTGVVIGGQIQIRVGDVIQQPTLRDAVKTGHLYVGWGSDTVNALPAGATFTSDMVDGEGNTLMLYAVWSPVEYVVQYRYMSDYSFSTINAEFGEVISIPALDRAGYTFKGWRITGADSNAYYSKDGSTWYKLGTTDVEGMYFRNMTSVNGGVVTMEAVWDTNEYRIAYNSNGGTGKVPVDTNVYRVGDMVQLQDYTVLSGTNGSKSVVGWSLEANGSSVIIVEFTEGLARQADATGSINLYAVWVDGMCTVIVDLGDASVSMVPAGWVQNLNGTYEKIVDYGTSTKDVMADWENVTVEKDGYNFTGWNYSSATITSAVTVEPIFEKVNMTILYAFGGVVATFVVGAIVFTRFGA